MAVILAHIVLHPPEIIDWYRANARELPWRAPGTTPWGVLLSEVMSHQTQVERVAPIWREWIERWPTPAAFDAAPTDEILRAWGTLGYPRRALRLKECARMLVDVHGGHVPRSVEDLLALPGIGEYTARAVACFAYGQNVAVVDTNVRRVYARAHRGEENLKPRKAEIAEVSALLPAQNGPVFSVGLMELGALVCKTNPLCEACPVTRCEWLERGKPKTFTKAPAQRFAGTDRQVRGKIMGVLRSATEPVPQSTIDVVWPDDAQRTRALYSLLDDGLAVQDERGYFHLPR